MQHCRSAPRKGLEVEGQRKEVVVAPRDDTHTLEQPRGLRLWQFLQSVEQTEL